MIAQSGRKCRSIPSALKRLLAIFVAFLVGWLVYMIAMTMTTYDGWTSMVLQPIMATLSSCLFVGVAVLLGLVLRVRVLSRWWKSSRLWAIVLIVASLIVLCFGSMMGITATYSDPETGREFVGLHSAAALGGFLALLFGIANWPFGHNKPKSSSPVVISTQPPPDA